MKWATKTRYQTPILNGGQQKHVTHPTLINEVGNKNTLPNPYINLNGGQQKHVTHPTLINEEGSQNDWATFLQLHDGITQCF